MAITLEQLLESRDARAARQAELLKAHPGQSLLCLTVIMPGPEKRSPRSLRIAAAAVAAVREVFSPDFEQLRDLETGYEGYFLLSQSMEDAKRGAVQLEDTHPLGRLFDLDVIGPDGPLSRSFIGAPERRCLLCDRPARECMRSRAHTTADLLAAIDALLGA